MKPLLLAFLFAQGADLTTTIVGLRGGCHEGNPTLERASVARIVGVKTGAIAAEVTIAWGAHKKGHTGAAKAILWTGIGTGTFAAIWNTRQITRCR